MTWPQAFAIVGFMASVAAMAWAFAWMIVRAEDDVLIGRRDTDEYEVDMRPPRKEQRK